jgi:hypothetical protein
MSLLLGQSFTPRSPWQRRCVPRPCWERPLNLCKGPCAVDPATGMSSLRVRYLLQFGNKHLKEQTIFLVHMFSWGKEERISSSIATGPSRHRHGLSSRVEWAHIASHQLFSPQLPLPSHPQARRARRIATLPRTRNATAAPSPQACILITVVYHVNDKQTRIRVITR